MKKYLYLLGAALICSSLAISCGGDDPEPTPDPETPVKPDSGTKPDPGTKPDTPTKPNYDSLPALPTYTPKQFPIEYAKYKVRDMALIYHGGSHRQAWDLDDFRPYVTHTFADGTTNWLFDSFLFLELHNGEGKQFSTGYQSGNANRKDWELYLQKLFGNNVGLGALDKCISEYKTKIGNPSFRHKVVLTCLIPIEKQTDWGSLNGVEMNFNKMSHRYHVAKWFIDQLVNSFRGMYRNLDLIGIYWIEESGEYGELAKYIKPYIESLGLDFIWIPYWNASGANRWQQMGIDMAYLQPNYFFSQNVPYDRFEQVVTFARNNHMGLEFECDERAVTDDAYAKRMDDYITAFEENGVFDNAAIAYYTGANAFTMGYDTPTARFTPVIDRLARHIVERQSKKDLVTE